MSAAATILPRGTGGISYHTQVLAECAWVSESTVTNLMSGIWFAQKQSYGQKTSLCMATKADPAPSWYSICTCSVSKSFLFLLFLIPSFVSYNVCREEQYQMLLYRRFSVEMKKYCKKESRSQQGTEITLHPKVPWECVLRDSNFKQFPSVMSAWVPLSSFGCLSFAALFLSFQWSTVSCL